MSQDKAKNTSLSNQEESASGAKEDSSQSLSSLANRLQKHSSKEQQLMEEMLSEKLQTLGSDLKGLISREQKAIERDIVGQRQRLQRLWKSECWLQLILGIMLCLSFLIASWGWAEYQISRASAAHRELMMVRENIERETPLMSKIETYPAKGNGVWVRVQSDQQFVMPVTLEGVSGTYVKALIRRR